MCDTDEDLEVVRQQDFQQRILRMTHSGDFRDLVQAQHEVAEDRGFHHPLLLVDYESGRRWRQQQLLHLCIEAGELADKFRKTSRIDLEEAADVFIVLADLVCINPNMAQLFYDTIAIKTMRNLRRPKSYGLATE